MTPVVGYLAAAMSVAAFLPQAWRIVKTRDTRSLSTGMWVLQVCAFATWTTYGVLQRELPIVIPNVICFLLAAFILAMKLAPARTRDHVADVLDPAGKAP